MNMCHESVLGKDDFKFLWDINILKDYEVCVRKLVFVLI